MHLTDRSCFTHSTVYVNRREEDSSDSVVVMSTGCLDKVPKHLSLTPNFHYVYHRRIVNDILTINMEVSTMESSVKGLAHCPNKHQRLTIACWP